MVTSAKDAADLGTFEVGPVQNVTSSRRVGKYTRPGGEVVAEYHSDVSPNALDQRDLPSNPTGQYSAWGRKPPFYQPPAILKQREPSGTAAFMDKPGFTLPVNNGGGILTEVSGSDNFVMSVAAQRNGAGLTHLKSKSWSVPWDMKIDATSHGNAGPDKPIAINDTKEVPKTLAGETANATTDYYKFTTVQQAIDAGVDVLLGSRGLAAARAKDQDSYKCMVHAIRGLNPAWSVKVDCIDNKDFWSDAMNVALKGNSGTKNVPFKLSKGDSNIAYVRVLEICDPETWGADDFSFTITGAKIEHKRVKATSPKEAGLETAQPCVFGSGNVSSYYKFSVTRTP
jgi:hypothetical protein